MNLSVTLAEIKGLSIDDRIRLVQAIWDSIEAESEQLTITESQKQELSRRMADHKANPDAVISWEAVKAQAQARICR
jgi:putative addiction module component (TIGR02574 family)